MDLYKHYMSETRKILFVCIENARRSQIDWNIPDPKGKPIDQVRKIRDEIEIKVKELVASL